MKIRSNLKAGAVTVYGTEWCGWTDKQRQYLNQQGIDYTFIDCDSQSCPSFVKGYPTLDVDGKILNGFSEI